MTRYFIELAYDGTRYHGWQVQPNASTVQETIEQIFSTFLKEEIRITGAGRTDTGVHASFFVAHFDSRDNALADDPDLVHKLNRFLPDDIVLKSIRSVSPEMHARFSARSRTYHYYIHQKKPLFNRDYCHYYFGELDAESIQRACDALLEYRDFTSFSKVHTDVKTNDCTIAYARWVATDDGFRFEIKADRFLRNMVRAIVGTLMEVGSGNISTEEFREIIASKDRARAGMSAPAKGLFLVDIEY
jgi:tRNA pseudouridine38-40 synthase